MAAELGLNRRCREEPDAGVLRSHPNKTTDSPAQEIQQNPILVYSNVVHIVETVELRKSTANAVSTSCGFENTVVTLWHKFVVVRRPVVDNGTARWPLC
jgi:hypothetical protein